MWLRNELRRCACEFGVAICASPWFNGHGIAPMAQPWSHKRALGGAAPRLCRYPLRQGSRWREIRAIASHANHTTPHHTICYSAQAVSEQEQIVGGSCGVICIARLFLLAGMNEFVLEIIPSLRSAGGIGSIAAFARPTSPHSYQCAVLGTALEATSSKGSPLRGPTPLP